MSQHDRLLSHAFPAVEHRFTARDTILYALGCGAGPQDLDLVYEPGLIALPSMASVLAYPGNWYARPEVALDGLRTVHGSERIELHADLPVEGHVRATPRITAIHDKGPGKGALVISAREVRDLGTDRLLATVTQRAFCRGDGGIGSFGGPASQPAPIPQRVPDREVQVQTSPRAAAIYRLMGDDNPLHIDPDFARAAGFDRPVLHGLCSYGHIARAILRHAPGAAVRLMDCRFAAPVFPGETMDLSLWDRPDGLAFRARVGPRVVIDNGEVAFHGR